MTVLKQPPGTARKEKELNRRHCTRLQLSSAPNPNLLSWDPKYPFFPRFLEGSSTFRAAFEINDGRFDGPASSEKAYVSSTRGLARALRGGRVCFHEPDEEL
ncbi:hypothetical protein KM043_010304 [Ampulex compressa]|nr:hypothetical protein KM043_010304 [Ampulex compressa]